MLSSHCDPMVRLMAQAGVHHFETVESFPRVLGLHMSMASAGIVPDSHICFKVPILGGSPLSENHNTNASPSTSTQGASLPGLSFDKLSEQSNHSCSVIVNVS